MYLIGTLQVTKVIPKEWDGRRYFKCQGIGDDKEVYAFSLNDGENPRSGDVFQMIVEPSDRDWKPFVRIQRADK